MNLYMNNAKGCIICGSEAVYEKVMTAGDIVTGELFAIVRCISCGVKKTEPVPVDLSRYYDANVGIAMRKPGMPLYRFLKGLLLNMELSRITKRLKTNEFLDVGCGAGEFSAIIYNKGLKISCTDSFDHKPPQIEDLSVRYYLINYDSYEIAEFAGMENGTVILRHVLEHVKDPVKFIKKLIGYGASSFYISLPNVDSLNSRLFGRYSWLFDPPRHIWHFNDRSIRNLFSRFGLEVAASGSDTIPMIVPSIYRFMRIKRFPAYIYGIFDPKGIVSTVSLPLDMLLPNNIMWYLVKMPAKEKVPGA